MRRIATLVLLTFIVAACTTSTSRPLKVLVYNIHAGKDAKGLDNLQRVADFVKSTSADIVLLQEVDIRTTRSGNVDQLATLKELTGMFGAFGKSLDYQGGDYGIAILSRWPISNETVVPLRIDPPQPRAGGSLEPRIAFLADTNGITVMNTHFDASREDTWRRQEVEALLRSAAERKPLLAGGDFNSEPDSAIRARMIEAGFRDAWSECGSGQQLTYPAGEPVKRIDYLFMARNARCSSASVIETEASDHRPVLFVVR